MPFIDKIKQDIKWAMKEKEADKLSVLRMLNAAVINREKKKMSELTDEEVIEVVSSEARKRKDSIEQYERGNRKDLAEKEKQELKILKNYLPEQMSEEEIRKIVREKIEELKINGISDMGPVMGAVMPQLKGKADGSVVSKIVQEELKK